MAKQLTPTAGPAAGPQHVHVDSERVLVAVGAVVFFLWTGSNSTKRKTGLTRGLITLRLCVQIRERKKKVRKTERISV